MELKELLKLTVERGASDLHISPNLSPWIRIGGELHEVNDLPPLTAEDTHRIIYSAMTPDQKKEFEARLELDFGIMISEFASFRVNAWMPCVFFSYPERMPMGFFCLVISGMP